MKKKGEWALLLIGVLMLLATVQGAVSYQYYTTYGYQYGAGGYPPYDGHQYYGYGPSSWTYHTTGDYYGGNHYLYQHYYPYQYYPNYGMGNYYYGSNYYNYGYGGFAMPYYYRYWPYTYRVYGSPW